LFKKHGPGCPCCSVNCPCEGEDPSYVGFKRVQVTISGLADTISYSVGRVTFSTVGGCGPLSLGYFFGDHVVSGLSALNGTHFLEVPYLANYCIDNEADATVDELLFTVTKTLNGGFYHLDTCASSVPVNRTDDFLVRLRLVRITDNHYRVNLQGLLAPPGAGFTQCETLYLAPIGLLACQNLGCGNEFDALESYVAEEYSVLDLANSEVLSNLCGNVTNMCNAGMIYAHTGTSDRCGFVGTGHCPQHIGGIFAEVVR